MNKSKNQSNNKRMTSPDQIKSKRWVYLLGGFLLSLMGGMSYAWGSFVVPLIEQWNWTAAQANLPFTVMIITFAVTMIPAGWLQDRVGPRKVATAGAAAFLIGYGLSGLIHYIPYPGWLIFTYGLIVGLACGLTYSCIAPTVRKWYPDRPGFAVSTSVMGFGLAAVAFAPLKKTMINLWGIDGTFLIFAVMVSIVALVGARILKNPPEANITQESRQVSDIKTNRLTDITKDVPPNEFVKTPVFYMLWLTLAMVIGGGLTAIGLITAYAEIKLSLAPAVAASAISAYSLSNGIGRPFVGFIADRTGTVKMMIIIYTLQAVVFFALPWVAVNLTVLVLCSLLLGLGYATTFALFPVLVASKYGAKYLGVNYGLVFSAFAAGAGTSLLGSWLWDKTGSFFPAFLLASGTTLLGIIFLLILRKRFGLK